MRARKKTKRVVRLFISACFYAAMHVRLALRKLAGAPAHYGCVILYYHAIPQDQRTQFAAQLDLIARITTAITVDSVSPLESNVRYSAITFDDGLESVVENAVPELIKRRLPATIFVTVGALGQSPTWWPHDAPERQDNVMSLEQMQSLPASLIAIGSHTLTHPMLTSVDKDRVWRELKASKTELERAAGRDIALFSFPFGAVSDEVVALCREAGYKRVFTSTHSIALKNESEFVSGRVAVEPWDWKVEFRLKLLGAYSWLPYASRWKRNIKLMFNGR